MVVLNSSYFNFGKVFINSLYDNVDIDNIDTIFIADTGLSKSNKEYFKKAVDFEKKLHKNYDLGLTRFQGKPYLHNSCKPLDEVHFDVNKSLDLFGNECEGMCGI